jgi:hypothetical protein
VEFIAVTTALEATFDERAWAAFQRVYVGLLECCLNYSSSVEALYHVMCAAQTKLNRGADSVGALGLKHP